MCTSLEVMGENLVMMYLQTELFLVLDSLSWLFTVWAERCLQL